MNIYKDYLQTDVMLNMHRFERLKKEKYQSNVGILPALQSIPPSSLLSAIPFEENDIEKYCFRKLCID